jgi:hypothetical protein
MSVLALIFLDSVPRALQGGNAARILLLCTSHLYGLHGSAVLALLSHNLRVKQAKRGNPRTNEQGFVHDYDRLKEQAAQYIERQRTGAEPFQMKAHQRSRNEGNMSPHRSRVQQLHKSNTSDYNPPEMIGPYSPSWSVTADDGVLFPPRKGVYVEEYVGEYPDEPTGRVSTPRVPSPYPAC